MWIFKWQSRVCWWVDDGWINGWLLCFHVHIYYHYIQLCSSSFISTRFALLFSGMYNNKIGSIIQDTSYRIRRRKKNKTIQIIFFLKTLCKHNYFIFFFLFLYGKLMSDVDSLNNYRKLPSVVYILLCYINYMTSSIMYIRYYTSAFNIIYFSWLHLGR